MRKLVELEGNFTFWSGTRLRKYNAGLNTIDESKNYYDYILAYATWEPSFMMLVNITEGIGKNKAGSIYGGLIKVKPGFNEVVVDVESLQKSLDDYGNWYLITD